MRTLESITIRNFKSIREQSLKLGRLNIFIGGNGSGKSNLIGAFHFLNRIVSGELQTYTGVAGGADSILYFGRRRSSSLSVELQFQEAEHANRYRFELLPTEEDRFVFTDEWVFYQHKPTYDSPMGIFLGAGHAESRLGSAEERVAKYVRDDLGSYRIYHFHDTSASARVKQTADVHDNRQLRTDAGNLPAFLYRLQQKHTEHFRNVEDTVRQIAPFFEGFHLEPSRLNPDKIQLEWKERGNDSYFNANALSDGTLRFICLATLFLQPNLAPVILIDEPELGLHPAAIALLAGLLRSASTRTQVLVATQSVTLVDQFTPEEVWVVEREQGESLFRHLNQADMSAWLEDYSLGELWQKNIFGGRP
jgi:predicted ATPase